MAKVEVRNLQRLVRKLNDLEKLEAIKPALQAAALHVKGVIAPYPPESEANDPGRKYWYERNYGPDLPGGSKKTSQVLRDRWTIKARDGGLTQVVGNNAKYAIYVHSKKHQMHKHGERGWKTDQEVLDEESDTVVKLLSDAVEKVLEKEDMTPDQALQIIERAEEIKARIEGGTLYGNRINTENVNHVIVAAYFLGREDYSDSLARWSDGNNILETVV